MSNPPKRPTSSSSPQSNPAVEELKAIKHELIELRRDFSKLNQELSMRIAFAVIASIVLISLGSGLLSLIFGRG